MDVSRFPFDPRNFRHDLHPRIQPKDIVKTDIGDFAHGLGVEASYQGQTRRNGYPQV